MGFLDPARRRPWAALELALAGLLLAWRARAPTWHPLGFDLLFYGALYWIALVFLPRDSKAAGALALALSGIFLAVYLKGQMPHMLVAADLLP